MKRRAVELSEHPTRSLKAKDWYIIVQIDKYSFYTKKYKKNLVDKQCFDTQNIHRLYSLNVNR